MPQVVGLRCPHCAAALKVEVGATSAKCDYCGTTSMLQRGGTFAGTSTAPKSGRTGGHTGNAGCAIVVVAFVLIGLGVFLFVVLARSSSAPTRPMPVHVQPVVAVPAVATPPVSPPPQPSREVLAIDTSRRPLLVDVDGDGLADIVALTEFIEGERLWSAYAAFASQTGALLWQAELPDGDARSTFAAAAHGRLLLLDDKGQVHGHDLRTGASQWTTALGERGKQFCASAAADAVEVPTLDARVLQLDVKTGRQTPVAAPPTCVPLPTDFTLAERDASNRSDPRAPAGTTAIRCGGVTSYTSAGMSRLPDQCRARTKIDTDNLPGIVPHALWQTDAGWLVLGVRKPGTYVPTLGLVNDRTRKLLWKADVPEGNPLLADEGGPDPAVLLPAHIVVGYTVKDQPPHLTAFALQDGARAWHIDVPGGKRIQHAALDRDRLFLYTDGAIHILDPNTGALARSLGRPTKP